MVTLRRSSYSSSSGNRPNPSYYISTNTTYTYPPSKTSERPLFALYPTDFDCDNETKWWYTIKDNTYDLNSINSKRRYEIRKGLKNFDVQQIDPLEYITEITYVERLSFEAYPIQYRPSPNSISETKLHDHFCSP